MVIDHVRRHERYHVEGVPKRNIISAIVKRVPETMPPQLFEKAGGKTQTAPVATCKNWPRDYDAIIFGTPTRFR